MVLKHMGIRIDDQIQKDFKYDVKNRYDKVKGVYGSEIANAMKLYLAVQGNDSYCDDPDVVSLLGKVGGFQNAHTHIKPLKSKIVSDDVVLDLVEEIKNLKTEMKQLRAEVKGKPSKKTGSMANFKKQFTAEYGHYNQVSKRDIVRFVSSNYDVHDSRSIQNRINYLLAHEVLEPYTHNVFNIKI